MFFLYENHVNHVTLFCAFHVWSILDKLWAHDAGCLVYIILKVSTYFADNTSLTWAHCNSQALSSNNLAMLSELSRLNMRKVETLYLMYLFELSHPLFKNFIKTPAIIWCLLYSQLTNLILTNFFYGRGGDDLPLRIVGGGGVSGYWVRQQFLHYFVLFKGFWRTCNMHKSTQYVIY